MNRLYFLFFLFFVSCSSLPVHTQSDLSPDSGDSSRAGETESIPVSQENSVHQRISDPAAYYHYILGYQYELDNNLAQAYQEYKSALILDPKSAHLLFETANVAFRLGDLKPAQGYIESYLEVEPDQWEGLALLGDILVNQNNLDQAIKIYQKAVALKPEIQETYFEIAALYMREKKYSDAEGAISQLIAKRPKSPVGYYYMGRIFLEEKKTKEALKQFKTALNQDAIYEPAWMGIGLIYETEGENKKAIQHYRKFLETAGPNHRDARYRLIQVLIQEKSFQEAQKELEDLLRLDPNDIEGNFRLAVLLAEKKEYGKAIHLIRGIIDHRGHDPRLLDYLGALYEANADDEKALESYEKVIEADKTYTDAYIHLASLYAKLKKVDEAIKVLNEGRKAEPQKADIFYSAEGWVNLQAERFNESLEAFNEAVRINPKNPDFHYNLGQVYDKMNRFEEMEKEMEKAIELEPNYANALNYLGYSYADKNMKLEEARDLIERALRIRPNDGFIIDSMGWVYYKRGQIDEAIAELKKALTFVPDDSTIHEHLGEAYLKKHLKNDAKEELLRSIEINPLNEKLIERYQEYGFGDPKTEERIQKALKKIDPFPSSKKTNQAETGHSKI